MARKTLADPKMEALLDELVKTAFTVASRDTALAKFDWDSLSDDEREVYKMVFVMGMSLDERIKAKTAPPAEGETPQ